MVKSDENEVAQIHLFLVETLHNMVFPVDCHQKKVNCVFFKKVILEQEWYLTLFSHKYKISYSNRLWARVLIA